MSSRERELERVLPITRTQDQEPTNQNQNQTQEIHSKQEEKSNKRNTTNLDILPSIRLPTPPTLRMYADGIRNVMQLREHEPILRRLHSVGGVGYDLFGKLECCWEELGGCRYDLVNAVFSVAGVCLKFEGWKLEEVCVSVVRKSK